MNLPPLANLFAVHDSDRSALNALVDRMAAHGEFEEIWRPNELWAVGVMRLPDSDADGEASRNRGLVFAEGRELFTDDSVDRGAATLERLAGVASETPDALDRFPGDFGFVHFQENGRVLVTRSCAGLAPMYLWRDGSRAAISTRLEWMAGWALPDPRPDGFVSALWATGWAWFPEGRSPLKEVSILARGCFAKFEPDGGFETSVYWNPRPDRLPDFSEDVAAEHASRFRSLLIEKLKRDLHPAGGNLLTLSGGVDSGSLAALAVGAAGRKVSTLSLLPTPDETFKREMSYIETLEREFGFERNWRHRLTAELLLEMPRHAPKAPFPIVNPSLCLLPQALKEAPVRVLFGGEFADRLAGCVSTIPDFMAAAGLGDILRHFGFSTLGRKLALSWAKRRLTGRVAETVPFPDELPEMFSAEAREEAKEFHDRELRMAADDDGPWKQLTLFLKQDGWLAMNWEAVSALGLRRSFPYFHRDAIELTYACHPAELVGPGTKKILRRALADDVPRRNLNRADKGAWGAYLMRRDNDPHEWSECLPACLQGVVREGWFPAPPKEIDFANAKRLTRMTVLDENIVRAAKVRTT